MRNDKALFQSSRLLALAIMVAGVILLGGNVWSSSNKSRKEAGVVKVNNHTQTCKVLSAEKHNGHIKLSIRNDSKKNMTAFVVALSTRPGDLFTVKEEFAYSEIDFVIAPGATYEKAISIPPSLDNQKTIPLTLLAVVFDDKSAEGDPQVVRGIEHERFGERVQLMRTISLLNKMLEQPESKVSTYFDETFKRDLSDALNGPESDVLTQLKKERPRIMSNQRVDELPDQLKEGLHTGQEYVLQKLHDLETLRNTDAGKSFRGEIIRIRETCERIISRL
jgi:hypothetical protein